MKDTNTIMAHLFNVERFEHFLGRTMTILETVGLSEKQEKALKDIVKQEIWSLWEHPWGIEEKTLMATGEVAEECICVIKHKGKCKSSKI